MPHRYSDLWRSLAKMLLGAPEFTPAEVAAEAGVDLQQVSIATQVDGLEGKFGHDF